MTGKSQVLDNPVSAGDKFYAKITSDGKGNYAMDLKDETKGWDATAKGTSAATTDQDADVLMQGYGATDTSPLPKFSPAVTVSGAMANGKSLASFTPTKNVLVDASNKTLIDTSDISAKGAFTFTSKG